MKLTISIVPLPLKYNVRTRVVVWYGFGILGIAGDSHHCCRLVWRRLDPYPSCYGGAAYPRLQRPLRTSLTDPNNQLKEDKFVFSSLTKN